MEAKYQVPRGTFDLLDEDILIWKKVEDVIRQTCALYGYEEIRTPIFEATEVFKGENDSSDMVNKEMYTFTDNGNRSLTLRPEGTKGVIRAFVEHKLFGNAADLPKKLFYIGPMFRYDRPQKGRYRQFHQFGVEAIGANDPLLDVETIALGCQIARSLGIKNLKVLVNSLGDKESRQAYRKVLTDYFTPHLDELCEDCHRRLKQNPLRVLDCKVDRDKDFFKKAPSMADYLNEPSQKYFATVLQGLKDLGIEYEIDPHLVRGLDYYTNTVFEVIPVDDNGQQATVFAGGQYDGLVESFGGGPLCGVGFGMGLERLIALMKEQNEDLVSKPANDVYVIAIGDVDDYGLLIAQKLRYLGCSVLLDYNHRGMKGQFKAAERSSSRLIIIVGEDEKNAQMVTIKNSATKQQVTVSLAELEKTVENMLKNGGEGNE